MVKKRKNNTDIPDFSSSYFGFNQFSEKLNGRIAMIALFIIFFIEYCFSIKIFKYLLQYTILF
jgi:hypothetical protein